MTRKRIAQTITITKLLKVFDSEETCIAWLEQSRWNGQPVCPHCQGRDSISPAHSKPFTYWHKPCRKHFTVKTGSVMHASKTPTQNWIVALYYILTARKGVSAMQLSKELGVQYRTAWYLLHRVREACASGEFQLQNIVEVDETYIGGKAKNKHQDKKPIHGRGTAGKQAVFGMRQRGGKTIAKPVPSTDKVTLQAEIAKAVQPGSILCTDDHGAYRDLDPTKYYHEAVNHSANQYVNGFAHTNGVESFWAMLKRALTGAYHHVSFKHLHRYINESAFRLNEGNCDVDTLDRMQAVIAGMSGKRIPYRELVA